MENKEEEQGKSKKKIYFIIAAWLVLFLYTVRNNFNDIGYVMQMAIIYAIIMFVIYNIVNAAKTIKHD